MNTLPSLRQRAGGYTVRRRVVHRVVVVVAELHARVALLNNEVLEDRAVVLAPLLGREGLHGRHVGRPTGA